MKAVRELNSVLNTQNADQSLQVAWADVNKIARREIRGHLFRVRVWDTDDLTEAAFRNYHKLDEELQAEPPPRASLDTGRRLTDGGSGRRPRAPPGSL